MVEIEAQGVLDAEDAHRTLGLPWLIERDLTQEVDRQEAEFWNVTGASPSRCKPRPLSTACRRATGGLRDRAG